MTDSELKTLKDNLWHAADVLRAGAHLAANKYGQPILGLIFLRYADILYKQHKAEIEAEYNKSKGTRAEKSIKDISIKYCGFYLPEEAYYTTINDAPDDANKATLVKKAMEAIERENEKMDGVLPKEVYGQLVPEEEPELLSNIMRIFMDIPENISVDPLWRNLRILSWRVCPSGRKRRRNLLYTCNRSPLHGRSSSATEWRKENLRPCLWFRRYVCSGSPFYAPSQQSFRRSNEVPLLRSRERTRHRKACKNESSFEQRPR